LQIPGLFKTELVRRHGPWKGLDGVEIATLEWVDWFNNRRLLDRGDRPHSPCRGTGQPLPRNRTV
jgi:hypothetical protein